MSGHDPQHPATYWEFVTGAPRAPPTRWCWATSTADGSPSPSSATRPNAWPQASTPTASGPAPSSAGSSRPASTRSCCSSRWRASARCSARSSRSCASARCATSPTRRSASPHRATRSGAASTTARWRRRSPTRSGARHGHRHAAHRRPGHAAAAARPERVAALAVLHVGIDRRSQGRVARPTRRSWPRACTRSSPRCSPPPTTSIRSCFPVGPHRRRVHARRRTHDRATMLRWSRRSTPSESRTSWPSRARRSSAPRCRCSRPTSPRKRAHGDERLFPHLRACVGGGAPKTAGIDDVIRAELGGIGIVAAGVSPSSPPRPAPRHDTGEQMEKSEGRPSPGVELRVVGPDGARVGTRRGGRAPPPRPAPVPGLREPGARRRRARRAGLLPHRRPRHRHRHRPRDDHRPAEGHHHPQRGEHLRQRDRGGPAPPPGDRRRRGHRPARRRAPASARARS